ncbi:MAG: DUF4412 domain-containing protein [Bacteroidales bacterium]|nr:DUF4412 domain-containing protein [Bacteroidales bacterium]MDT8374111.1 DUF4412 domain-containing protein [Bacteroidales bacterium]
MKTKGFILFLAAAFLLPLNAEAQLGSKLKKKLEETVSKALEKEVTEEAAEAAGQETEGEEQQGRAFDLSKLGIGKVTATYEENYDFRGMMAMKTEIYDNGKPEGVIDADIWMNAEKGNIGMESKTITDDEGQSLRASVIVDSKNRVMITVADVQGGKTGMIMTIPDSLTAETYDPDAGAESDVTVRKTGGIKTICGYRCDEYEVTEDNGKMKTTVWATDDLKLSGDMKLLGSQKGMPRNYGGNTIKGVMMASETYEKGNLVSRSEVTKVDLNATHSISLAGISMIQMDMGKRSQRNK